MNRIAATLFAAGALALAPLAAEAQFSYRCVGADGKKYYGSTIPERCFGRPVEQLNNQGLVVRRLDASGLDEKQAAKAAKARAAAGLDTSSMTPQEREEARRNSALLATYNNEREIDSARQRALQDYAREVKGIETKIEQVKADQAKLGRELDFYQKDPKKGKVPQQLTDDIANTERELAAQQQLLASKKKDMIDVNTRYDAEKKKYIELKKAQDAADAKAAAARKKP